MDAEKMELFVSPCWDKKDTQKWIFENIDMDRMYKWDEEM